MIDRGQGRSERQRGLRVGAAGTCIRAGGFALLLAGGRAAAQDRVRVEVRDDAGARVAFALVGIAGGQGRVSGDSGAVELRVKAADSLNLRVRRIGYAQHDGWVKRGEGNLYVVTVQRLAAQLATVNVNAAAAPANAPLVARGFYDRVDRVQKGAMIADFWTPEQLDERGASSVTQLLAGARYARVTSMQWRNQTSLRVIVSRGGCPMTILLDGEHVKGTVQDYALAQTPQSLNPNATRRVRDVEDENTPAPPTIDDVVDARAVMAVEVYASAANAPTELQRTSVDGRCGIVALWTGGRR